MFVKIIKNESDYAAALEQLSEAMGKQYKPGSEEENSLELLMLVIEDYEKKNTQPIKPDPIEAIKFRMEQMHLSKKDLIPFIGSISKVSEVLSGKRNLSLSMIRKLYSGLGIPLASLLGENSFPDALKIDYQAFPLKEMQLRGCFGRTKRKLSDLKEYAEELIIDFCKGYEGFLDQNVAFLRAPLHRRGKKKIDKYALAIWQICVLKQAEKSSHFPKYNKDLINEAWLKEFVKLSIHNDGPKIVKEYLGRFGIAFVIEPHYKKTFLDGAAMMYKERPVIALTMRHNRVDNFWFVLAHELVHLIKHINMNREGMSVFIDDLDDNRALDTIEVEADSVANEALISKKVWENSKIDKAQSAEEIIAFAQKNHVHPAIVAGRIRHKRKNYRLFSKLMSKVPFQAD